MEDINKLLKDVTRVSSAAEKYSKKYNAGIKNSTSGNTSSIVSEQATKFYKRATLNIDKMAHQSMRLAAITAKKTLQISTTTSQKAMTMTKDGLKEMTRELSKDFGVETKNVLAMAMSRSMPIFGYALTRALNNDTIKRFAEAGASGVKNVASSSGEFIKEKLGMAKEKAKEKLSNMKEKAQNRHREKELVKKVEGIVPKLAVGGYLKRDSVIKAHKGEIVAPIDKLLDPLQKIADNIEKLITDFRKYLVQSSSGTFSANPEDIGSLVPGMGKSKLTRSKIFKSSVDTFHNFVEAITFKLTTKTRAYVKSDREKEEKGMAKAFMTAYRQAWNDVDAPAQERMLRATLEIRNALTNGTKQRALIHESMMAQNKLYRQVFILSKLTYKIASTPFKVIGRFFKKKGGYASVIPKNLPAQEMTASILGSLYVDSMVKYDSMIANQSTMIKILSGGNEAGELPKRKIAKSYIQKLLGLFGAGKEGLLGDVLDKGLLKGYLSHRKTKTKTLKGEIDYVTHGPKSSKLDLLGVATEQLMVLRKIRDAIVAGLPSRMKGSFKTKIEGQEGKFDAISKLPASVRMRMLMVQKEKDKRKIDERNKDLKEKEDRLKYQKEFDKHKKSREFVKSRISIDQLVQNRKWYKIQTEKYKHSLNEAKKGKLAEMGIDISDKIKNSKFAKSKSGQKIGMFGTTIGKLAKRNDPITIFKNIRNTLQKHWILAKKEAKGKNKLWSLIKSIGLFLWNGFKKVTSFLGGILKALGGAAVGAMGGIAGGMAAGGGIMATLGTGLTAALPIIIPLIVTAVLAYMAKKAITYFIDKKFKKESKADYAEKASRAKQAVELNKSEHAKYSLIGKTGFEKMKKIAGISNFRSTFRDPMIAEKIKDGRQKVYFSNTGFYERYNQEEVQNAYIGFNKGKHPEIGVNEEPHKYGERYEKAFIKYLEKHGHKTLKQKAIDLAKKSYTKGKELTTKGIKQGVDLAKKGFDVAKEKGKDAKAALIAQKDYYANQIEVLQIKVEYWWSQHKEALVKIQTDLKEKATKYRDLAVSWWNNQKIELELTGDYLKERYEFFKTDVWMAKENARKAFQAKLVDYKKVAKSYYDNFKNNATMMQEDLALRYEFFKTDVWMAKENVKKVAKNYYEDIKAKMPEYKKLAKSYYDNLKSKAENLKDDMTIQLELFKINTSVWTAEAKSYYKNIVKIVKQKKDEYTVKAKAMYDSRVTELQDMIDFLDLQSDIYSIKAEHYVRKNITAIQKSAKEKLIKFQAKATPKTEESSGSEKIVKIEANKIILATKLTAKEFSASTGKAITNLAEDSKKNLDKVGKIISTNISNVITNNTSVVNSNQQVPNVTPIDSSIQLLIQGDVT